MKRVPFFNNPVLRGPLPAWRARLVLILLLGGFVLLVARAIFLQGFSTDFLQQQGERRYERTLTLAASRGKILDRNGVVLAASMPARAIWAIPEDARTATPAQLRALAKHLEIPAAALAQRFTREEKNFVYLKRQIPMEVADKIRQLDIPGIHQQPETRRYYPESNVMAHVVGVTNVEDQGQEGIELAFNQHLSGRPGSRRVIKDRLGRVIEDVQAVTPPRDGQDLQLSIDTRVQYLVFKALKDAMLRHRARGAAAVVLDVRTGEILGMASLPTYDPSDRRAWHPRALRNQVITDTFEPGSIMKPFTAALALDLERITPATWFETGKGRFHYQGATISDVSSNGTLQVADILRRSSNIGMALIAERLHPDEMWQRFTELGFGQAPALRFPGAAPGRLRPWKQWRLIEKATMAYGYGMSASLLQIARAYSAFARDGDMVPLTLQKRGTPARADQHQDMTSSTVLSVQNQAIASSVVFSAQHQDMTSLNTQKLDTPPPSVRVYSPIVAKQMRRILEAAAGPEGAKLAQVQGYRVAGKSGTARKIVGGKYSFHRYRSSFVGFAPVSAPRIVVAISLDEPQMGTYYGGAVAAPVYSEIVGNTLRLLGVQPDAPFTSTIVAGLQGSAQ